MNTRNLFILSLAAAIVASNLSAQNIVDILPSSHSVPITSVIYQVDGATVVQNTSATGVMANRNDPVYLQSVTINDGGTIRTLDSFNSLGATVVNVNFTPTTTGVGVFKNGTMTTTADMGSFIDALAGTTQDTDLMNYHYYDHVSNMPSADVSDYDLLFQFGFEVEDYVLVSERWGNTYFELTPLDSAGNPISGANILRFGYPTGSAYSKYSWNSGYAADSYHSSQAMAFSVASVSKFFEGGSAASQPVFGFRIDNNGEADVKFFGLSDNSFADNTPNSHPAIPEPSAALLALLGGLAACLRRRRRD